MPVTYTGILPDLFQEGKGVVAQGKLGADGVFRADQVLAKHDENYMPPEAAEALKKRQAGPRWPTLAKPPRRRPPMIPELGHFALILALAVALLAQSALPLVGAWRGNAGLDGAGAAGGAWRSSLLVLIAFGCLTHAFVAQRLLGRCWWPSTPTSTLPLHYRIAAVWGNHEGSMLLWVLILAGWTLAVALFSRQLPTIAWWRACSASWA